MKNSDRTIKVKGPQNLVNSPLATTGPLGERSLPFHPFRQAGTPRNTSEAKDSLPSAGKGIPAFFRQSLRCSGERVSLSPIDAACCVGAEDSGNFIAHAAENGELLLLGASGVCGIIEGEMVAVHLAGKYWTGLIRISTDGDDGFDFILEEFIEVL